MIKRWELIINDKVYETAKIIEYIDGTFQIDTGHIQSNRYYKSYKACEKYLLKNGYTPIK